MLRQTCGSLILLLGALIVAIGTALAARSMFAGASAPQVEAAAPEPEPAEHGQVDPGLDSHLGNHRDHVLGGDVAG